MREAQNENPKNDSDVAAPRSFLKEKAAQLNSKQRSSLGPSITPSEQEAFDNIFTLFEKSDASGSTKRPTSVDHTDTDYKNIVELFASLSRSSNEAIPGINDELNDEHASSQDLEPRQSDIDDDSHSLPTYPPARTTREAAMTEIREFLTDTDSIEPGTHSTDAIRSAVFKIVEDVADSLTSALQSTDPRPDIAMWKVAEQKIFPLIQLLRPSTSTLSSPAPATEPTSLLQTHPLIPPTVPLLPLLNLAYPSLTLLLIRLYSTHHPTSPYALALLPTLKSLGPTSYVLGANTHLYNSLLSLQWTIYSSLRGIASLLAEMEANGVDFDLGTWSVLKQVEEDREHDMNGIGERGATWWGRAEQRMWWQKVGLEWKEVLTSKLEEKGLSTGEVMREGSASGEERVFDSAMDPERGSEQYVVTL